jgi:hypothetical protein
MYCTHVARLLPAADEVYVRAWLASAEVVLEAAPGGTRVSECTLCTWTGGTAPAAAPQSLSRESSAVRTYVHACRTYATRCVCT